jgi:hypothetical protein
MKFIQFNRVWAKSDWQHAQTRHLHSNLLRFPSEWVFNPNDKYSWIYGYEFKNVIEFVKGLSTQDKKIIWKYSKRLEKHQSSKNALLLINKFIDRFRMSFWIKFPKIILDDKEPQNVIFEFWHKPTERKIVKKLVENRKIISIRGLSLKKITNKFNDEMNQIVKSIKDIII